MALTEKQKKYQREYREKNGLEKYRESRALYQKEWTKRNPNYLKEFREKCLIHYGGEDYHCNCCGEKTYEFLCLDHINGGGNEHRKSVSGKKQSGGTIYRWLVKNNFPKGFQVLCHNCNLAKGFYGECPHKNRL